MSNLFSQLAKNELDEVLAKLPSDPMQKFILFAEVVRVLDYWVFFQPLFPKDKQLPIHDFDIITWGWNLALEHLYVPVSVPGAFPLMESTNESRNIAISLLHKFGKSVLLQRASEMIKYGFLQVTEEDQQFKVSTANNAKDHFLDNIEFFHQEELEKTLSDKSKNSSNGWKLVDINERSKIEKAPGSFFSRSTEKPLQHLKTKDVEKLMEPLIYQWDSGHRIMMGYGALPEIDSHFFAEAAEIVSEWRTEAGFHPNANLNGVSGADITAAITFIVSLCLKHRVFALVALRTQPKISIPQSLTVWEPLEQLQTALADLTGMDKHTAKKVLDFVTVRPNETAYLHGVTKIFFPLLIDLGNGVVMRPISSLIKNPFASVIALQAWRNPKVLENLFSHREDWMRTEIYSAFQGTRYKRVNGNVKLRREKNILTDIDGAIFDTLTGELAVFQIKWQNYFTNDIRELRSKASNLTKELDEWADKVDLWIHENGYKELIKTLRLKLEEGMTVSSVYLFGVSRTYARMQGFGFKTKNQMLAIANFPQFHRIRFEIGPVNHVFRDMFQTFKREMTDSAHLSKPLPFTIITSGTSICFEDFWNAYGEEDNLQETQQ